jgi:hypothetical protein
MLIFALTILVDVIDLCCCCFVVTRCGGLIIGLASPHGPFRSYGGLLFFVDSFGLFEDAD